MVRPAWVEVDLDAVRANVATLRRLVEPSKVCAVVKADAYGHGDVPVSEAALEAGAEWLAVALVEEGVRLREAGIQAPILLLAEPPLEDAGEVFEWSLVPTVYRPEFVQALQSAKGKGPRIPVHVKIDTGMHRLGAYGALAARVARSIARSQDLELEGVWTHFANAEEDLDFTKLQLDVLKGFVAALGEEGITPRLVHAANTAGALLYPQARLDMVRLGIAIYGLRPAGVGDLVIELQPAMRVVSQVEQVRRLPAGSRPSYGRLRPLEREASVATIPIGYADGVARRLGETGGQVLIKGKKFPFAGALTMDHVLVDVGEEPVEVGDEVVLLGHQGNEEISAENWAARLGTIAYEVVCGFGPRLPRRYR